MNQPTPGPWYQTASDPAGLCVYAEDNGAHRRLAVLDTKNVNGAGADNARLIAAAPALLEALEFAVAEMGWLAEANSPNSRLGKACGPAIQKARAAIAQAQGKVDVAP